AVNFSGKLYHANFYGVERETGLIDMDKVAEKAREVKPKLIICGASSYSREWDFARFRKIADEVGALVLADISHPSGLIAKGLMNSPLPHCHIVTSTTHKTLRGPRGGVIMMGRDFENPFGQLTPKGNVKMMSEILNSAVFPGTQGGPLEHIIAAKAVAFGEALTKEFLEYQIQVRKNAKVLEKYFLEKGYNLVSGGTDNHLLLIDLRNKNITGKAAENCLSQVDITVNKNMVPFDDQKPFITSGIRIGTAAITSRQMKESDMTFIVDAIDKALMNKDNTEILASVKLEIHKFASNFPLPQ
ncbi:MAG: serine hydroxymethyltransferase, partial [Chitinophagales bacterium]|nr:serine hydroxymethyltransferase [Chitinophagales bacterium]